jgi:ribosome biogenesis GTPase / thiamine phosphate phosphatase
MSLTALGFIPFFADQAAARPDLVPARVTAEGQDLFWLAGSQAPLGAMTGRLRRHERPVVGDWVLVADDPGRATIHQILERRTVFARRASGTTGETQVLAVNVDVVFIVTSANQDLNARRLERYLTQVRSGGATPVVVVNKLDLVDDAAATLAAVRQVDSQVDVVGARAKDGDVSALLSYMQPGVTVAFVGSSGVGKSSLTNVFLGAATQGTADLMSDDKGRHTTTRRELFVCSSGALVIDTPGMRELGLIEDIDIDVTFPDIVRLAQTCRFGDCKHEAEPGCAVHAAIASGEIARERLDSYKKLLHETAVAEERKVRAAARDKSRRNR